MSETPSASAPFVTLLAEQVLAVWEQVPEARIILDSEWRYQFLNPAACALLGLGPDVVGRDARLVHPDASMTAFGTAYRKVMTTREPEEVVHHYAPLDSHLRARIFPVPDGGISIALTDVTERRRPGNRLRRNLDLYQQVLDQTTQALTLRDLDGRFLLVNQVAAARIGRPAGDIVGLLPEDVFPPDIAAAVRATDRLVQHTAQPQANPGADALHPDRKVVSQIFPVHDDEGTLIGLGTTVADVTDLAVAQAELAASQSRFRRVFGTTSLGVLVMGSNGRLLEANSALCRLLGYSREALLGMTGRDLVVATSHDFDQRRNRLRIEGPDGYEIEEEFVRSDSQRVPVLLTVNSFNDPAGRGQLVSCVVRDLTDLHQLQAQLVTAERMEAVGRLAAGIAHDANNILAAVSGYAELLRGEIHELPAAQRHLDGIARSIERAGEMVARLLAFTRGQPMAPRLVDLAELVSDLEDMLRRLLPARVRLALDLQPAPAWADPSQIRQVMLNLVVNARNAVAGSGTVTITTGYADERYVTLAVRDDGPGMTAEVVRRCFEPFFTTRQDQGGTGVGLSTAHGIALQSGGDLRVKTQVGAGATFDLILPRADRPASPARGPAARARVLVADDNVALREVMVETLRAAGYVVTQAADGLSALHAAADIDLVVSDIEMPQLGGLEVAARLAVERPGLPVLLMSGTTTAPSGRRFLAKPFTRVALLAAVDAALGGGP